MARTLVYRMWPFAWGGLNEMTEHLTRVKELAANYVCLGPLAPLPTYDHICELTDLMAIDRRFGTLQDFDDFVATAHRLGIKVLMELCLDSVSPYRPYENALDWLPDNKLNYRLARKFKKIVNFWLREHSIDGFNLRPSRSLDGYLSGNKSRSYDFPANIQVTEAINAIFVRHCPPKTRSGKHPFLMLECLDQTPDGDIMGYYHCYTPVDFIMNVAFKDAIDGGLGAFQAKLDAMAQKPYFMLDVESPDSERFTTRSGLTATGVAEVMFESQAQGICLYQGQEVAATEPTRSALPPEKYSYRGVYSMYCLVASSWKHRQR